MLQAHEETKRSHEDEKAAHEATKMELETLRASMRDMQAELSLRVQVSRQPEVDIRVETEEPVRKPDDQAPAKDGLRQRDKPTPSQTMTLDPAAASSQDTASGSGASSPLGREAGQSGRTHASLPSAPLAASQVPLLARALQKCSVVQFGAGFHGNDLPLICH